MLRGVKVNRRLGQRTVSCRIIVSATSTGKMIELHAGFLKIGGTLTVVSIILFRRWFWLGCLIYRVPCHSWGSLTNGTRAA